MPDKNTMTQKELNRHIDTILKLFKNDIYPSKDKLIGQASKIPIDNVIREMKKLNLISDIDLMKGYETWQLTTFGHEILRYGGWRIYLFIKFSKSSVIFMGGLWTIIGTIAALVFGYLTWSKDNELDKQIELNRQLHKQSDSLRNNWVEEKQRLEEKVRKDSIKYFSKDSLDKNLKVIK
jgi:hypothetical protein